MQRILSDHFNREEIKLGPLFGEYFSIEEQHKIIGYMLWRTRAETLQEVIPWLMSCLTQDEQNAVMAVWRKVTISTNFHEWLGEGWEGIKICSRASDEEGSRVSTSLALDLLEIVSKYLWKDISTIEGNCQQKVSQLSERQSVNYDDEQSQPFNFNKQPDSEIYQNWFEQQDLAKLPKEPKKGNCNKNANGTNQADEVSRKIAVCHEEHPLVLTQKELETAIRRISRDSTLDSQKKSHLIQSLPMSHWMVTQQRSNMISTITIGQEEDIGQCPSYRDPLKLIFGCKRYKRNCKLLAPCCKKLYTCIRSHDELTDHSVDRKVVTQMMYMKCLTCRKAITQMMYMKCLIIQSIDPKCSNLACNNFSMSGYYCRICKLFDDKRNIIPQVL